MSGSTEIYEVLQRIVQTRNDEFLTQNAELLANLVEQWQQYAEQKVSGSLNTEETVKTNIAPALPESVVEPTLSASKDATKIVSGSLNAEETGKTNIAPVLPESVVEPTLSASEEETTKIVSGSLNTESCLSVGGQSVPSVIFDPQKLPNAVRLRPYQVRLPQPLTDFRCKPECGLSWNADTQCIEGEPTVAGEIQVLYKTASQPNTPIVRQLYINPNPRDLWQDLPSDVNVRFYKPDHAQDEVVTASARLLAARTRGRSHAHVGSCCDDDFVIRHFADDDAYLLCVSDGAGSAAFARYGSQLAVNAVAQTLQDGLREKPLATLDDNQRASAAYHWIQTAAYQAFLAQHKAALDEKIELKSLSCTLLIALVLPLQNSKWLTVAYWVGDGAVAVYDAQAVRVHMLGEGDSGSYSGETRFLSKQEVDETALKNRTRHVLSEQMPIVLLMTDGVSDAKFETDAQLNQAAAWHKLWQELQSPLNAPDTKNALHEWLQFWSPGNHDDRTLALLQPLSAPRADIASAQPNETV